MSNETDLSLFICISRQTKTNNLLLVFFLLFTLYIARAGEVEGELSGFVSSNSDAVVWIGNIRSIVDGVSAFAGLVQERAGSTGSSVDTAADIELLLRSSASQTDDITPKCDIQVRYRYLPVRSGERDLLDSYELTGAPARAPFLRKARLDGAWRYMGVGNGFVFGLVSVILVYYFRRLMIN